MAPFGPDIANGVINNPSDGYTDNERTESYIANVTTDFKNNLNLSILRMASSIESLQLDGGHRNGVQSVR